MRPSSRSGGTTPSADVRPVYEDFRPVMEWQQDEESNSLLLIYLPGFQREHLKALIEGASLRIRGERLVAGNKWSRFQEDYTIPDDCNVKGIRAKFEGGILTITLPRKEEVKASKEATKVTQDTPKPSQKPKEDLSSRKQPSPSQVAPEKTHQKAADDISGPSTLPSVSALGKRRTEITQETPPDQKMTLERPRKGLNEKQDELKEESDYQKIAQKVEKLDDMPRDVAIKKTIEESKAQKDKGDSAYNKGLRPLKAEKPEKSEQKGDGARKMKNVVPDQVPDNMTKTTERSKQERGYQKSAQEIQKVPDRFENIKREKEVKPKLQKDKGEVKPKERKTTKAVVASSSSDYRLASYKQTVKNFLELNEERQLLVNVGAAVLVMVAFGAYLTYTFQEKQH